MENKFLIYQKRNCQETPYWPQSKGEPGETKDKELAKQGNTYMFFFLTKETLIC
jgi:hypothetical protein